MIAIENVRLFNELTRATGAAEALEQQTATGEILRVICARRPMLTGVRRDRCSGAQTVRRQHGERVAFDGEMLHLVALSGTRLDGWKRSGRVWPRPLVRGSGSQPGRAVAQRRRHSRIRSGPGPCGAGGLRDRLSARTGHPMLRENQRSARSPWSGRDPGPFPEKQIALLQTFADQAVIAIENVRLFNELEARTPELTQSVEELQALGEVGQAVSSSLDLETVLSTIVARATQLAGMDGGSIYGEEAREASAAHGARLPDELIEALRSRPVPIGDAQSGIGSTVDPVAIRDIKDDGPPEPGPRDPSPAWLSVPARVPLLCEGRGSAGWSSTATAPVRSRRGDRAAEDLRRPGGDRDPERAAVQRDPGEEPAARDRQPPQVAFLANMSHELRTPLNAIIGFTRIVMRRSQEQLEPKQFENLEKILASGQHLLALINSILDLSKVEAGRVEVQPCEVRLAPVLEQCLRTVEPLIKEP